MKPESVRTGVLVAAGAAILLIWWLSRAAWTSRTETLGIRGDEYTEWTTTTEERGQGADYFLGGSLILLFAGGWMFYAAARPDPDLQIAGVISLACALHAAIALGRLFVEFVNLPDDPTMRYYSGGHDLTPSAAGASLATLVLASLGAACWLLARRAPAPSLPAP